MCIRDSTYHTLRRVRQNLLSKLSRVPMGTILDTPSGQYKTTIVDRVEGMEPTLAHLLPEMTSNLLVPVSIAVYIFVLDWRMGLASLVTTVIGFAVASQSGKTYAARWQGAVEVGRQIQEELALDPRVTILGHIQRGGSPTAKDRVMATRMGYEAVRVLAEGKTNRVICAKDDQIIDLDIDEGLAMKKTLNSEEFKVMTVMTGM